MRNGTVDTEQQTPSQPATPALLTVPEACAQLRISRWMLYRLIHTRQLTTIKLGRRRLVPRTAVMTLVEGLAREADS
ncbi:MAG: helix-turn-helix domain-containing protein [Jatrophihabitantaceae bacterium]